MTRLPRLIACVVLLAVVSACEPEPVEKTVWDDQVKALEKAGEVEDELAKRADQLANDLGYDAGVNEDEDEDKPSRR